MSTSRPRIASLDALRGLVVVLMTMDHVQDFFSPLDASPTDLDTTTPAFFFVRWLTHLCAPAFVLLMGVGAALREQRHPGDQRQFLLTRGLWLVFLELTWVSFCWTWSPTFFHFGVLWALGGSMVLLVPFVGRSRRVAVGLAVGLTTLLAVCPVPADTLGVDGLLRPGHADVFGLTLRAPYALIPWFLVALAGWGIGPWLAGARRSRVALLGLGLLIGGLVLRALHLGDGDLWGIHGRGAWFTTLDFLSLSKYPPSPVFLMVMTGLNLVLLAGPMHGDSAVVRQLQVFGRVPLFYYLVHIPLAHILGNALSIAIYGQPSIPESAPVSIALIVGATAVVVAILTPVSRAWDRLKRQRRDLWFLRYL